MEASPIAGEAVHSAVDRAENQKNLVSENENSEIQKFSRENFSKSRRKNRWAIVPAKHRKILQLLREGYGVKATAKIVGVGVRTVQRRKKLQLDRAAAADGEKEEKLEVAFRDLRSPHVCPQHGPVKVWPCVACAALAAAANSKRGTPLKPA